jgi:hypothetical protein
MIAPPAVEPRFRGRAPYRRQCPDPQVRSFGTGAPCITRSVAPFGNRIDRSWPVSFSFEGQRFTGYNGDTIASAHAATGQWMRSRSCRYHHPRAVLYGRSPVGTLRPGGDRQTRSAHVDAVVIRCDGATEILLDVATSAAVSRTIRH